MGYIKIWLSTRRMWLAINLYGLSYRAMPYPYKSLFSKHLTNFVEDVRELQKGDMV